MDFIKRHWAWTIGVAVILLPLLVFTVWAAVSLNYTYSSGDRAGFLQKLSKKGWLCKTYEGELQMTAIPGAAPEKFYFTIRSDSLAAEVDKYAGKPVVLHYEQHKGVPTSCFGETEYFVVGVRPQTSP